MQIPKIIELDKVEAIEEINSGLFQQTLDFALEDHPRSWKAAWLLNQVVSKYSSDIKTNDIRICKSIPEKRSNQQRELLRLLENVEITSNNEGYIFDAALSCWEDLKAQSATRMVGFRLMLKIATKHEELLQEVENLMEERYLKT